MSAEFKGRSAKEQLFVITAASKLFNVEIDLPGLLGKLFGGLTTRLDACVLERVDLIACDVCHIVDLDLAKIALGILKVRLDAGIIRIEDYSGNLIGHIHAGK